MGNPKQKWTAEEEEALRAGVLKHGPGKWKNIQKDPDFNPLLCSRSNIDLKDKWRNMSVANGQNPREKSRTSKLKGNPDAPATPLLLTQGPASSAPVPNDAPADAVMDESLKCKLDGSSALKYNGLITEALSAVKDPNGSDMNSLVSFVEVRNGYRISATRNAMSEGKGAAPKLRDMVNHPTQTQRYLCDTVEDAAVGAAYKVAEAENKSFVAAEAVKEADRVAEMAEDADSFLQLATEIFERCSRGERVVIA